MSKPPLFTRLGCSLLISVLTLMLAGLIVGGLTAMQFYFSGHLSEELGNLLTKGIYWIFYLAPWVTILLSAIAFFESVDFLLWLKEKRQ